MNLNTTKLTPSQLTSYTLPYPKATTSAQVLENLNHIEEKIKACTRNLTYFDLYRITSVVTDAKQLNSQIGSLAPYSSLVINTPIYGEGKHYNQGDVLIKYADGSIEHIEAQSGGVFYPQSIEKRSGNSYRIKFAFASSAPTKNEDIAKPTGANTYTAEYAKNMFYDFGVDEVKSPYNYTYSTNSIATTFSAAKSSNSNTPIDPIISLSFDGEEVYTDMEYSYNEVTNQYTVNCASGNLICKMVVK